MLDRSVSFEKMLAELQPYLTGILPLISDIRVFFFGTSCSDNSRSGAYLGGAIVPCPPFRVPVIHKYQIIVRKVESWPPPLEFGQKIWAEPR